MTKQATPKWEQFAQQDPEVYIWAKERAGATYQDEFFASGRYEAPRLLDRVEPFLHARELVVEYGCGVGRLLIPMSEHFDAALGVDISPTMLGKLQANCTDQGVSNVRGTLASDNWQDTTQADLLYCWAVFQHIDSTPVIREALARIATALKPDTGIALLHFDTERRSPAYWARFAIPDVLLPRFWRRSIRCIRRPPRQVRRLLAGAGLHILQETAEHPAYRLFIVHAPAPVLPAPRS